MKDKNNKSKKGKGTIALSQIFLLVLSTIAVSYLLASSLPLVSAAEAGGQCVKDNGVTVEISSINLNEWCEKNGKTAACIYSSGVYQSVRDHKKVTCPAEEDSGGGSVNTNNLPISAVAAAAVERFKPEPIITPPDTSLPEPIEPPKVTPEKEPGLFSYFSTKPTAGGGWKGVGGYIASNAAVAYGIGKTVGWGLQLLGADEKTAENFGSSAAWGYFAGSMAAKVASGIGAQGFWTASFLGLPVLGWIGGGIWVLWSLFTWKDSRYYQVTFSCMQWDASTGENDCKLCNSEDIPCTEYRCMSLGTHCTYLEEEQLCVFDNREDTTPPIIEPWEEVLTEGYEYSPDNAISPPNRGVKIVNPKKDEGCIEPFTPLEFGISLDKPARCKISLTGGRSFEDMGNMFMGGKGLTIYNHSNIIPPIPSAGALKAENLTLREGGEFSLYIRCETRQGYSTQSDFVFNLCVDDGPDIDAPEITRTSITNNAPVSYFDEGEEREVNLTIYTHEPAQCRWSRLEQAYEDMPAESQINCPASLNPLDTADAGDYRCEQTTLTGLKNRENNDYYFSCIDQPKAEEESLRNAMEVPYHFRLIGTQPLLLDSAEPNNTIIRDSTDVIKVMLKAKTSAGYDKGKSRCEFKRNDEDEKRYVIFLGDEDYSNYEHEQRQDLAAGIYSYDIRCVDLGGNAATTTISFTIETDTTAPTIVRAFREGDYLKIGTEEDAKCVYNDVLTIGCIYDFEDGTEMDREDVKYGTTHSLPWNSDKTFYIKCEDEFKNRPNPADKCSIIARPYGD